MSDDSKQLQIGFAQRFAFRCVREQKAIGLAVWQGQQVASDVT